MRLSRNRRSIVFWAVLPALLSGVCRRLCDGPPGSRSVFFLLSALHSLSSWAYNWINALTFVETRYAALHVACWKTANECLVSQVFVASKLACVVLQANEARSTNAQAQSRTKKYDWRREPASWRDWVNEWSSLIFVKFLLLLLFKQRRTHLLKSLITAAKIKVHMCLQLQRSATQLYTFVAFYKNNWNTRFLSNVCTSGNDCCSYMLPCSRCRNGLFKNSSRFSRNSFPPDPDQTLRFSVLDLIQWS